MADGSDNAGTAEPTTKRLDSKRQTLDDAYSVPANLLEIEVLNPEIHGFGRNRHTDYEIKMKVRLCCDYVCCPSKSLMRRNRIEVLVSCNIGC